MPRCPPPRCAQPAALPPAAAALPDAAPCFQLPPPCWVRRHLACRFPLSSGRGCPPPAWGCAAAPRRRRQQAWWRAGAGAGEGPPTCRPMSRDCEKTAGGGGGAVLKAPELAPPASTPCPPSWAQGPLLVEPLAALYFGATPPPPPIPSSLSDLGVLCDSCVARVASVRCGVVGSSGSLGSNCSNSSGLIGAAAGAGAPARGPKNTVCKLVPVGPPLCLRNPPLGP